MAKNKKLDEILKEIKKNSDSQSQKEKKNWGINPGESFFEYLRRIVKYFKWWAILTFIIGLPASIWGGIQLYEWIKNRDAYTLLYKSTENEILEIQNTFNPEELSNDTSYYSRLLQDFQQQAIDLCILWKSVYESKSSKDFNKLPLEEYVGVVINENNRSMDLNSKMRDVVVQIEKISMYEAFTDSTHRTNISKAKLKDVVSSSSLWEKKDSVLAKKCNELLIDALNHQNKDDSEFKKSLNKAVSIMDKQRKCLEKLHTYSLLFDFLIDSNRMYYMSKRYYSTIPPYKLIKDTFLNKDSTFTEEQIMAFINIYMSSLESD